MGEKPYPPVVVVVIILLFVQSAPFVTHVADHEVGHHLVVLDQLGGVAQAWLPARRLGCSFVS